MFKKQFRYMTCAKRSLLFHGLHHNGYISIICLIFKESENSDTFQFWRFPILTLSNSDTFQFWHFPILTLSNSDTFQFWHFPILTLSDSDIFQFWHFPISSKMGKNWILTLANSDNFQPPQNSIETRFPGYFCHSPCWNSDS